MRKRGEVLTPGLDLASFTFKDHKLGRGMIVHADNQITVGYGVTLDDRVKNREVVKNANVIIVSPVEIEIVSFGPKGPEVHEPFEAASGFKATRFYAKTQARLVQASSYFMDFMKYTGTSGRLLDLKIRTGNEDLSSGEVASHADVESIHAHIPFLLSPEFVVFEV